MMTPRHSQLARLSGGLPSNLWLLSSRVEAGNLPQWRGPCPVGRRILDIGTLLSRSTLALIDELMFTLQKRVARHAPPGSAPRERSCSRDHLNRSVEAARPGEDPSERSVGQSLGAHRADIAMSLTVRHHDDQLVRIQLPPRLAIEWTAIQDDECRRVSR